MYKVPGYYSVCVACFSSASFPESGSSAIQILGQGPSLELIIGYFTFMPCSPAEQGFTTLALLTFGVDNSLLWGYCEHIECLASSLASTHWITVAPPSSTNQNCLHMSPSTPKKGHSHSQLTTITVDLTQVGPQGHHPERDRRLMAEVARGSLTEDSQDSSQIRSDS